MTTPREQLLEAIIEERKESDDKYSFKWVEKAAWGALSFLGIGILGVIASRIFVK